MSQYGRSTSGTLTGRVSTKDLDATEVLEAVVFRESHTVPGTVKERRAAVFPEYVGIFSSKKRSTNVKKASKLAKKWMLVGRCTVSTPALKTFSQLQTRHHHKLLALMSGHYREVELWTVILHCPDKQKAAEHGILSLCFASQATAEQWYGVISERIGHNNSPGRRIHRGSHAPSDSSLESAVSIDETPRPSGQSEDEGFPHEHSGALPALTSSPSSLLPRSTSTPGVRFSPGEEQEMFPGRQSPFSQTWTLQDRRDSSLLDQELLEVLERRVTAQEGPPDGTWNAFSCKDGLTGCVGFAGDNERAIMLSYVVRAPPRLVVKVMLHDNGMGLHTMRMASLGLSHPEHLETVDPYTEFSRAVYRVPSLARLFFAPREIVYKRSWRKEDDGTYVVLLSSVEHPKAPAQPAPWWHWFSPIRAQVESTGWTLTPLSPSYTHGHESSETLVTMVAKVDLKGWLSPECWLGRLMQPLQQGWGFSWRWRSFAATFLQQAEVLRTQAEAERFVLRPFLRGNENSTERHAASRPETAGDSRPVSAPSMSKASMLARLRTKSILEGYSGFKVKPEPEPPMTALVSDPSIPALVADRDAPLPHTLSRILSESLPDAEPGRPSLDLSVPSPFPATGTCDAKYWTCPGTAGFKVRGPNYLRDHQKELSEEPLLQLASVDLIALDAATPHIARYLPWVRDSAAPFTFLVQIMVPGATPVSLSIAWAAQAPPDSPSGHPASAQQAPIDLSLARFLAGGDSPEAQERRNSTFKLIPRVTEGSWIVKQSVGTTPCLMGRKLRTAYHRGERYLEVDIDVASSSVASTVVGMVQGATKGLVVDMGIVLEGHAPDELPERLLGSVRFSRVDMNPTVALDSSTGELVKRGDVGGKKGKRASRRSTAEHQKKAN